jgi:DNA gyrase subunit B
MATKSKKSVESVQYGDESVVVLEGLEGIRQRFDMYVGSKDSASFHLVKEVVDNSVDEALNGHATTIWVEYFPKTNRIRIEDDGRGLPTGMNAKMKKPTIEVLFTYLHAGGKFNKDAFKVSGGKNGIGVKATNALSKDLVVDSFRDGEHYQMKFNQGKVVSKLTKIGATKRRGTRIEFTPDDSILGEFAKLNVDMLKEELNKRTYINAGLVIELKVDKEKTRFVHENGIEDYLIDINKDPMSEIIGYEFDDKKGNNYQVVFNYANGTGETIKSFVNGISTSKGTHETGFKTGLTNAMLDFIKANNLIPKKLDGLEIKGEDVREGLFAVINLKHVLPEFKGQVKDELSNNDVLGELRKVTQEQTTEWLNENPEVAKKIANRVVAFAKGRKDANAIKDKIVKVNSGSSGLSFSASFSDCDSRDIEENEVIIIEGKSAGGNVRNARDAIIQAVFPLRGKPLNSYKISNSKILANKEFRELIKIIFGTTDIKNVDFENPRYGKIVILADADDDGYHIVCLLLTFFYEHFRKLVEDGRIHIALSPLYRISKNGKFIYFKNDKEYDKFIVKEIGSKFAVKDISLSKFIVTGKDFISKFNTIKSKHHLDVQVLNLIENYYSVTGDIRSKEIIEDFKEMGLTVDQSIKGQLKVEGLYNDIWHNFIIDNLFEKDIKILSEVFPDLDVISLENKKNGEVQEDLYIYDVLKTLNDSTKYERVRFKGLGEADAEELFETTLDPKRRDLIQVDIEDFEGADDLTKVLFGNNADLRKDFINEHL